MNHLEMSGDEVTDEQGM